MKYSAYTIKNIPPDLWKQVKLLAIRRDMTIRELILFLLEREVREEQRNDNK